MPKSSEMLEALNKRVSLLADERPDIRAARLRAKARFTISHAADELLFREGISVAYVIRHGYVTEVELLSCLNSSSDFQPTLGFLLRLSRSVGRLVIVELVLIAHQRLSRDRGKHPKPIAVFAYTHDRFRRYPVDARELEPQGVESPIPEIFLTAMRQDTTLWELSDIADRFEAYVRLKFMPIASGRSSVTVRRSADIASDFASLSGYVLGSDEA